MFKKEKIKDLHYSVNGTISASDLQAAADEILLEYGKKAKMPGFRAGKIPLSILRQKYNASAYGEAIDKLMNNDLNNYVADKKIRLERIMKRDGISESDALLRINAQPDEEYYKSRSDIIISNNGEDLTNQINFIQEG